MLTDDIIETPGSLEIIVGERETTIRAQWKGPLTIVVTRTSLEQATEAYFNAVHTFAPRAAEARS